MPERKCPVPLQSEPSRSKTKPATISAIPMSRSGTHALRPPSQRVNATTNTPQGKPKPMRMFMKTPPVSHIETGSANML